MSKEPVAGAKAPAFTLPRDGGGKVSLKEFKGRNLVLYFYPKADTPGCTKEALAFSRLRAEFAKAGTAISRGLCRPSTLPGQIQIQT